MLIDVAYTLLLILAVSMMLSMPLFPQKRLEHVFFAIFCGSLAMVAIRALGAETLGPYQYIVALGTCGTCNVIWLIAIALFRGEKSVSTIHYGVAIGIALLVVTGQSINWLESMHWVEHQSMLWLDRSVGEMSTLLSSTVLMLGFWESVRGYGSSSKAEQVQRSIFATAFFAGVFACTVVAEGFISESILPQVRPWLVVCSAIGILSATFAVLVLQKKQRTYQAKLLAAEEKDAQPQGPIDASLMADIERVMMAEKYYLQSDLKMMDIANRLKVSEYKVSRAIRSHSTATNFNHYVNAYRLEHAKQLLQLKECQHWTILVISLESGFASLAPFNRAFKAEFGCTPNQYRLQRAAADTAQVCV